MTQLISNTHNLPYATIIPSDFPEEDDVELEEGFIETEEDAEDDEDGDIEWLYEEETQIDGPMGPIIIKKGRYTDLV